MTREAEEIIKICMNLHEYERKQIISCLIASMLTELSDKEARKTYDKIINQLTKATE